MSIRSAEFGYARRGIAGVAAVVAATALAGCGNEFAGSPLPKETPSVMLEKQERSLLAPALKRMGGQAIAFWRRAKRNNLEREDMVTETKDGPHDYSLEIFTIRGDENYQIDVEMRNLGEAGSVTDVWVTTTNESKPEVLTSYEISTAPLLEASMAAIYPGYKLVKGKPKKVSKSSGPSTFLITPGTLYAGDKIGYSESQVKKMRKIVNATIKAGQSAMDSALHGER